MGPREEGKTRGPAPPPRSRRPKECAGGKIRMGKKEPRNPGGGRGACTRAGVGPNRGRTPSPPIYVGGGRGAFARVAQFGDAWLANGLPPEELEPMLGGLREVAGRDVPTTVFNASSDLEDLQEYRRLGVERVLLGLPTLPESETLQELDNLADLVTDIR